MKTIKLLFAIILLILCSNSFSQNLEEDPIEVNYVTTNSKSILVDLDTIGSWYPANTFPLLTDSTIYPAAAIIGDTIYVQKPEWTGTTNYASSNIIKYKINHYGGGSWTNGASMPKARIAGSMTACNGKLYYIGGDSVTFTSGGSRMSNTVFEYNPSTGVWTTKATMPVKLTTHGAVCWGDSVIFVIGGPNNNSGTNLNVYYYRPASDSWGTITNSLPTGQGRRTFSIGIYQNKIIIAGGYNTAYLKSTYIGTIGTDASQLTWTIGPDLPLATQYTGLARAGGTVSNGKFFVVAGQYSSGYRSDSTLVYDFASNSWVTVIDNKPFYGDNIFNGVVSRIETTDTIQVYVPGLYRGATIGGTRIFDVLQYPLPSSAGSISGATEVCQGDNSIVYTVPSIPNAATYVWTLPSGATGTSSTNSISVNYGLSATSGNITVKGINPCGEGTISTLSITVNPKPSTPTIVLNFNTLHSDAPSGNQWYYNNNPISGAIDQDYVVTANGDYFDIVTINGCSSDTSNIITVIDVDIDIFANNKMIHVFPNPSNGVLLVKNNQQPFSSYIIEISDTQGKLVFKENITQESQQINLPDLSKGLYLIKAYNKSFIKTEKLVIN